MQEKRCDFGISERFKYIREKLHLTQKEFAGKLGLKQTDISKIENNRKQLDPQTMRKAAQIFQISISWLVAEIGSEFIDNKTDNAPDIDIDPELAELIQSAKRVLTSGNDVASRALEHNIRYFDHAITAEKRADEMEGIVKEMQKDMEIMMKELEKLKLENQRLGTGGAEQSSKDQAA